MMARVFLRGPGTEGVPPQVVTFGGSLADGTYRNLATDWWEDLPACVITHAEVHLEDGRVVDVPIAVKPTPAEGQR